MSQHLGKLLLTAIGASVSIGTASAGTIDSSAFNGVTDGAVSTAGTLDWGYWSNDGGMFNESYNAADYGSINDGGNPAVSYTTAEGSPGIGNVTLTEGTTGTNTVSAQTNNANFTFDGNASFGSYGGFAPGESDVWTIAFNDLGIGTFNITLYLGHSASNRGFDFDVTLDDGGVISSQTTTTGGGIGGLGSTLAAYGSTGLSFTYDITVSTSNAGADLTLTHGDTGGGSFGGAIFAGYTVTGTIIPEPGSLALLGLGGLLVASRRRRA